MNAEAGLPRRARVLLNLVPRRSTRTGNAAGRPPTPAVRIPAPILEENAMTTVYDLVAAQAERVPTATAVIAGERRTSYRELTALAARFAQGLAEPAANLIGVCLPRDERMVAGILAVW